MSGQHSEWLSLLDVSGPFLAEPVLNEALPQGLEGLDPEKKKIVRQAYDEWREAIDLGDPEIPKLHKAWVELILRDILEFGTELHKGNDIPEGLRCAIPEHDVILRPGFVLSDPPSLLVTVLDPDTSLTEPVKSGTWIASPAERMIELCRATGVRTGLVTDGERWMLVDAPVGAVTSQASWYGRLWGQEPVTLQAFLTLLDVRRFFGPEAGRLPTLLDKSLSLQDEVTDALGEQVRRAVEVLIQALDRADVDRNRELLKGIAPRQLYEAGLTVLMRIVFLLSAEERGLLLLGDLRYERNYAVSTLRMQLRSESEEVLERRWDAWSRLLSIFRAVYGGIDHEIMRLPALGGSLFDPDRFPFLEGRAEGSRWVADPATPLPIDNRTVLLLLESVQLFHGRTLSYLALDVEQIGYVYEGLLERTVSRAGEVTLDLAGTQKAKNPWVKLSDIDDAVADGDDVLANLLIEHTGSSSTRIANALSRKVDDEASSKLLTGCQGNKVLRDRIVPYYHLLRIDRWGYPLVYPKDTFMVTTGTDRRETGTHYTPKSFTEAIVKETLEPLVFVGPLEGLPRDAWRLKSSAEILDLKICDPAMGSGAFLVQVCRWLGERLVEAWARAEGEGKSVTADGVVVKRLESSEPLRADKEERSITARRLIAERCLYGVDMNPLAVELAKLSIWLVTLAKGRPFGFLDHNLRSGDSLLGIKNLAQLEFLDINPGAESAKKLFASKIDEAVRKAVGLRTDLRSRPIRDIRDVEVMARLDEQARQRLAHVDLAADALIGRYLASSGGSVDTTALSLEVGGVLAGDAQRMAALSRQADNDLSTDLPDGSSVRRPFHWPIEFPEVFEVGRGGFDAFVGNPPFVGGQMLSGNFGAAYQTYLVNYETYEEKASVDLVVFFFLRTFNLLRGIGCMGLLARRSIAEGKNREAGLTQILQRGGTIYSARTNIEWPGKASVIVHRIQISKTRWQGLLTLDDRVVSTISAELGDAEFWEAKRLAENVGRMFQGTILLSEGFKISDDTAESLLKSDAKYRDVVFPFIGGSEVNRDPRYGPSGYVLCFWDWPEEKAKQFSEAYRIILSEVKPGRQQKKPNGEYKLRNPLPQRWWQYGEKRPALYHCIGRGNVFENHPSSWKKDDPGCSRVIVISTGVTKYPVFTVLPPNLMYSNKLCVLADERFATFAILSSDIHGVWAWSQKTSLGGDLHSLVYAHGNIFETFPFPSEMLDRGDGDLEKVGREFFDVRQAFMIEENKGLTKSYNEFHNPARKSDTLDNLHALQSEMNGLVARRYHWHDLDLTCGFHKVGYLPEGSNTRFTIGEVQRREVLHRLSVLNRTNSETQTLPDVEQIATEVDDEDGLDAVDLFSSSGAIDARSPRRTR